VSGMPTLRKPVTVRAPPEICSRSRSTCTLELGILRDGVGWLSKVPCANSAGGPADNTTRSPTANRLTPTITPAVAKAAIGKTAGSMLASAPCFFLVGWPCRRAVLPRGRAIKSARIQRVRGPTLKSPATRARVCPWPTKAKLARLDCPSLFGQRTASVRTRKRARRRSTHNEQPPSVCTNPGCVPVQSANILMTTRRINNEPGRIVLSPRLDRPSRKAASARSIDGGRTHVRPTHDRLGRDTAQRIPMRNRSSNSSGTPLRRRSTSPVWRRARGAKCFIDRSRLESARSRFVGYGTLADRLSANSPTSSSRIRDSRSVARP
jgi:hypothetical protein